LESNAVFPAIRLFEHAARAVDDQFKLDDRNIGAVADICRRLEGIPLAIELAAAQTDVMGIESIAAELSRRFDLLSRGVRGTARHRTLNEALRWSYDLLDPVQRSGLNAFAVFAGSFDLAAAQVMTAHLDISADATLRIICDLVDKSLLTIDADGPNYRYHLLETTRAYAAERSQETDEWNGLRAIHADYLIVRLRALFAEFSVETIGEAGSLASDIDQSLDWAFGVAGDAGLGVTLTAAASPFWMKLGVNDRLDHLAQARAAIASGAAKLDDPAEEIFLEYTLAMAYYCARAVCPEMEDAFRRASDLARATGNLTGEIKGCRLAYALFGNDGAYEAELAATERYRALTIDNENGFTEFVYYRMMARSLHDLGRNAEALSFSRRALAAAPASTTRMPPYDDAVGLWCVAKGTLSRIMWVFGFPDQAREIAEESLAEGLATDHPTLASWTLAYNVCPVDFWHGDLDQAAEHIALLQIQSQSVVEHRSGWATLYADILQAMRNDRTVMLDRARLRTRRGQADIFATLPVALPREFILGLDTTGESWALPEVLRRRAEQYLFDHGLDGREVAEDMLLRGRDTAVAQGALSWELRNALAFWRLRSLQGRPRDALSALERVYVRFSEGFATPDLVAARAVLNGTASAAA
jgi:predicted ATPase